MVYISRLYCNYNTEPAAVKVKPLMVLALQLEYAWRARAVSSIARLQWNQRDS